jgi:hypothetical protein
MFLNKKISLGNKLDLEVFQFMLVAYKEKQNDFIA